MIVLVFQLFLFRLEFLVLILELFFLGLQLLIFGAQLLVWARSSFLSVSSRVTLCFSSWFSAES